MKRNMGLTPRERLHLNLLQQADYKSLRHVDDLRAARGIFTGLFISGAIWAAFIAWWVWG